MVAIPGLNMCDGQVHDDERLVLPLELPHHRTAGGGRGGVLHLLKKRTNKLVDQEHLDFSSRSTVLAHLDSPLGVSPINNVQQVKLFLHLQVVSSIFLHMLFHYKEYSFIDNWKADATLGVLMFEMRVK